MDHLPEREDEGDFDVHLYVATTERYKPDDFFSIPTRYGFDDIPKLLDEGLYNKNMRRTEANKFLQSWLFFGLLSQVLGTEICVEHFYKPGLKVNRLLSTKRLNDYLLNWEQSKMRPSASESQDDWQRRTIRAGLALNNARTFIQKWCSEKDFHRKNAPGQSYEELESASDVLVHSTETSSPIELDHLMCLSLAILGETLERKMPKHDTEDEAAKFLSWNMQHDQQRSWGNSQYLREFMLKAKWCPRDIRRLQMTMPNVSTIYYISSLNLRQTEGDHGDCDDWNCRVPITVAVRHLPKCGGRCQFEQPDETKIERILESGKIPLVTYTRNGKLETSEHDFSGSGSQISFGAVSHVWSDGLGQSKTEDQGLPRCQLESLQSSFTDLPGNDVPKGQDMPFWIDTLCIPHHDYHLKAKAISQMRDVYYKAQVVLVLDADLLRSTISDTIEPNVRILTGLWAQRLWTLQEGMLAKKLHFKFKNGFLNTDQLEERKINARENSSHPFHHVYKAGRPFSLAMRSLLNRKEGEKVQVSHVWQAAQFRSTTVDTDETICLSTLFGLDPGDVLDIKPEEEEAKTRRMITFLRMLDYHVGIPSGMIFLPGKHLNTPGYGWAPESWMTQQRMAYAYPLYYEKARAAHLTSRGLLVEYPGVKLHAPKLPVKRVFWVPVSRNFDKWYKVKANPDEADWAKHWARASRSPPPAIILSRLEPRETGEIAILVESINTRSESGKEFRRSRGDTMGQRPMQGLGSA